MVKGGVSVCPLSPGGLAVWGLVHKVVLLTMMLADSVSGSKTILASRLRSISLTCWTFCSRETSWKP